MVRRTTARPADELDWPDQRYAPDQKAVQSSSCWRKLSHTQLMTTVPEAAKRAQKNPETIRRWIREGKLRSQKVGTQHLIDEEQLDALTSATEIIPLRAAEATITGEPMPNFVAALHRSRSSH